MLPFSTESGCAPAFALLLDGLVHDTISRLARLKSFHVIARGCAFALGGTLQPIPRLPELL